MITGCVGNVNDNMDDNTNAERGTTGNSSQCDHSDLKEKKMETKGDVLRHVEIEPDTLSSEYDADLTATVLRDSITTEHTARVRVLFVHTGNEPQAYTFGDNPPFTNRWDDRDEHVWALDVVEEEHELVSEECWAVEEETIGKDDVATSEEFQHCEALYTDLDLWQLWRGDDDQCMPTGTYRFEQQYDVGKLAEADDSFRWGFDLSISEP